MPLLLVRLLVEHDMLPFDPQLDCSSSMSDFHMRLTNIRAWYKANALSDEITIKASTSAPA
jgi:hypothetical protein